MCADSVAVPPEAEPSAEQVESRVMAKAPRAKGLKASAYKSTGTTRDGVRVVKPKTQPKHFTEAQLKKAVAAALRAVQKPAAPAKTSLAASDALRVEPRSDGKFSVKRAGGKRALAITDTQGEGAAKARQIEPGKAPIVKRVNKVTGHRKGEWRKG